MSHPQCVAAGNHDEQDDLGKALAHAEAHQGHDEVRIGPGTFTGPFNYVGGADQTNGVEIHGAGPQTVVTLPQGPNAKIALKLDHPNGAGVTVSDLAIKVPAGSINTGLQLTRGIASNLKVSFGAGSTDVIGVILAHGSLYDSEVTVPNQGSTAVQTYGDYSRVFNSTLRGRFGVYAEATTQTTAIVHTRIEAELGVTVACGKVIVQDVAISGPNNFGGLLVGTSCGSGDTDVEARHLTAVGGPSGSAGVLVDEFGDGNSANVRLLDSTLTGFASPLVRKSYKGFSKIVTDWSNYSTTGQLEEDSSGGTGSILASHRIDVAPGFVSPAAGDFRLTPGSPLIDAGDPAPPEPFEPTTDLGGKPRLVAGTIGGTPRRDIGAHEYQPPPPEPKPEPKPEPAVAPKLTLTGAKRQRVRRQRVVVVARSDQAVNLKTKGSVKVGRRTFKLRGATVSAAAKGATVKLALKLSKRNARTVRRLLGNRRARARATVTVTAIAPSGLRATVKRRVALIR